MQLYAAGQNDYGQCGVDPKTAGKVILHPTLVGLEALEGAVVEMIALGWHFTLLLARRRAYHAGYNDNGQRGNGATDSAPHPDFAAVPLPQAAVEIAAGSSFALALLADRTAASWGIADARLGRGGDGKVPLPVEGLRDVKNLYAGGYFAFALLTSGEVYSWGCNGYGQLCLGCVGDKDRPQRVAALCAKVLSLALSDNAGIALCSDGSALAWGRLNGRMTDGADWAAEGGCLPIRVECGGTVRAVAAGFEHFGVISGDQLVSWGNNYDGQLGRDGPAERPAPCPFPYGGGTVSTVICTAFCTLAKAGEQWVLCGSGDEGLPLLSSGTVRSLIPVPAPWGPYPKQASCQGKSIFYTSGPLPEAATDGDEAPSGAAADALPGQSDEPVRQGPAGQALRPSRSAEQAAPPTAEGHEAALAAAKGRVAELEAALAAAKARDAKLVAAEARITKLEATVTEGDALLATERARNEELQRALSAAKKIAEGAAPPAGLRQPWPTLVSFTQSVFRRVYDSCPSDKYKTVRQIDRAVEAVFAVISEESGSSSFEEFEKMHDAMIELTVVRDGVEFVVNRQLAKPDGSTLSAHEQAEMIAALTHNPVTRACVFWTAGKLFDKDRASRCAKIEGREMEFCGMINWMIRTDREDILAPIMPFLRALCSYTNVERAGDEADVRKQWDMVKDITEMGIDSQGKPIRYKTLYRGGSLKSDCLSFFVPGKGYRAQGFLATTPLREKAEYFIKRTCNSDGCCKMEGCEPVLWKLLVDKDRHCMHATYIERSLLYQKKGDQPGAATEVEFLFAAYSWFEVRSVYRGNGTQLDPTVITVRCAVDNTEHPADAPTSPWN